MMYTRKTILALALSGLSSAALAENVLVYDLHPDGNLTSAGEVLGGDALEAVVKRAGLTFGTPEIIVRDLATGKLMPAYAGPEEWEMIHGRGDGWVGRQWTDINAIPERPPIELFPEDGEQGSQDAGQSIDLEAIPEQPPIELFDDDGNPLSGAGDAPIELFPDEGGPIQPLDGTWRAEVVDVSVTGCPQDVAAGVLGDTGSTTARLTFSQPMHPRDIGGGYGQLSWSRDGENGWRSDVVDHAQGPVSVSKVLTMQVVSPRQIDLLSVFDIHVPPEVVAAAAMAGVTMSTHCNATIIGKHTKID